MASTGMKSNADMFAERGDPWDAPERPSRTRPYGTPMRITGDAYAQRLKMERSARVAEQLRTLKSLAREHQKLEASLRVDLDPFLKAGRALPLSQRLAKERNHVLKPQEQSVDPAVSQKAAAVAERHHALARVAGNRMRSRNPVVKVK